ncbi:cyclophilin-like fold protein [Paenibacillus sp. Dod16]|uniref:cyclophilin-like fold protein n=1 Tax=Paenibacillus sp. Dod16 TaxID=3416392 RepID=UPI003CF33264
MKIKLTIEQDQYTATLNNSKAAADFIGLLPMTLTLEDYAGMEKISDLPKRLATDRSPKSKSASIGDITYYAPWGNLAIFFRDFRNSPDLIKLGSIDAGGEKLSSYKGPVEARLDILEE